MRSRTDIKSGSKSEETRLRILSSALELFHEKGFEATTMRDIATRADVATGAAYYYFDSKDALVLAFYSQATKEMAPRIGEALSASTDLRKRLAGLMEVKLKYFKSSRRLLTALAAHGDPEHPLSPFNERSRDIREQDIAFFDRAISGSRTRVADDLKAALPRLLWMYQMGIILYWIHDRSPAQQKTAALMEKSLGIIVRLIQLSSLPLMSPLRRQALDLYALVSD
jgi:AcrR family transcriptional regulator